ncbi:hypothetical protein IGB42_01730 [Andreprevotia sp. IGB-42]|uniref:DUF3619 family protein n=1 Tax=Andreprevotia sp. IGB-42 TaxID=2497473 RepID=UPI00135B0818|nr:DUF3619 family protein [Andreprevotia sp. IGB-42]KAF0814050.1 hypothetical protein IGB42_01730 [Andreprevotia sp. IGB-42]
MNAEQAKPEVARRVTEQLDKLPVSARAQARLNQIQALALSHAANQPRWAGIAGWVNQHWHAHPAAWGSAVTLCVLAAIGGAWQMHGREGDSELETMLLADDIPLEALANNRMQAWSADLH